MMSMEMMCDKNMLIALFFITPKPTNKFTVIRSQYETDLADLADFRAAQLVK